MPRLKVPGSALRVARPIAAEAARRRLPVYLVGGCVRDWLLGRGSFDLDFVVEGDPAPLARACAKRLGGRAEAFGRFGTLRVLSKNLRVDFAMSRREEYPEPASLPRVAPAPILEDLRRRDFSVNAMALRLSPSGAGELVDPLGGLADLDARLIRVLHGESFRDDPTRVFRAARYLCRFGFSPAPGLADLAREALHEGHARRLSRHRLAAELLRVLAERDPSCAFRRLRAWGYLQLVHPGLRWPARALPGVEERLAALALALPEREGERFVASLELERPTAARLNEVLQLAGRRASPRGEPSELARRVLPSVFKGLPRAALRPLLVDGGDLKDLGVPPGERYRRILDEAARAQWAGRLSSRARALAWLARAAKAPMRAVLLAAGCALLAAPLRAAGPETELSRLRRTVEELASPRLEGRAPLSAGSGLARDLIVSELAQAGALPAGDAGGYEQEVLSRLPGRRRIGANVVAYIPGRRRPDECVYIDAHYDHWGRSGGVLQPGANDNATGVAVLLGLARRLSRQRPDRSVVLLASDNEEGAILPMLGGMKGAYYQAAHPFCRPDKIKGALVLDMLGGRFARGLDGHLFLLGSESSPQTYSLVKALADDPGAPVPVRQFGVYVIEPMGSIVPRGDYDAFRRRGIPYVFATSGTAPEYHTARDTADTIDYAFLEKAERELYRLAGVLAAEGFRPVYAARDSEVIDWDRELASAEYLLGHALDGRSAAAQPAVYEKLQAILLTLSRATSLAREERVRAVRKGFAQAALGLMKANGGVRSGDLLYRDYGP